MNDNPNVRKGETPGVMGKLVDAVYDDMKSAHNNFRKNFAGRGKVDFWGPQLVRQYTVAMKVLKAQLFMLECCRVMKSALKNAGQEKLANRMKERKKNVTKSTLVLKQKILALRAELTRHEIPIPEVTTTGPYGAPKGWDAYFQWQIDTCDMTPVRERE